MASKKSKSARKAAAKRSDKAAEKSATQKAPPEPSASARKAQIDAQQPIEPVGPGVEHEDHEGGMTDSLAKKGVRGPLPTAEEKEEAAKDEEDVVRAPSVRERQTGLGALIARGGYRGVRDTVDAKGNVVPAQRGAAAAIAARKGSKIVPVVARSLGQYPADGRLRAPGEAFDYVMQDSEEKLPSWMEDPSGAIESRDPFEVIGGVAPTALIEVRGASADNVSVRAGSAETAAANRANRAKSVI